MRTENGAHDPLANLALVSARVHPARRPKISDNSNFGQAPQLIAR